jgi:NAD(P)-dependent dehydrogenase (short-subunit alcohol dehydrogenase family)
MSLAGKVYAITGGASGIGLATAKLIAERGGTVCIADIDPKALADTEAYFKEKGTTFSVANVNVAKKDQVENWIAGIASQYGRLDGAANIAGVIGNVHSKGTVADLEDDEWERIISVNLTGCMYCMRAELNHVVDGGSIVNMASIHSLKGKSASSPIGRRI